MAALTRVASRIGLGFVLEVFASYMTHWSAVSTPQVENI